MNRRQFLGTLAGVPFALKAITTGDWQQASKIPLDGWKISFPDGTIFQFQGIITSLTRKAAIDSLTTDTFSVRPTGEMTISKGTSSKDRVFISRDGKDIGEITDITPPQLQRSEIDVTYGGLFGGKADEHRTFVPGLKRIGPMTFTVLLEVE